MRLVTANWQKFLARCHGPSGLKSDPSGTAWWHLPSDFEQCSTPEPSDSTLKIMTCTAAKWPQNHPQPVDMYQLSKTWGNLRNRTCWVLGLLRLLCSLFFLNRLVGFPKKKKKTPCLLAQATWRLLSPQCTAFWATRNFWWKYFSPIKRMTAVSAGSVHHGWSNYDESFLATTTNALQEGDREFDDTACEECESYALP